MRSYAFLFNAVVPGAGHLLAGYSLRGLLIFVYFGLMVDGIFVGLYGPTVGPSSDYLVITSASFAFILWLYGLSDIWKRSYGRYRESVQAEKDKHLRAGLVHHLSGKYEKAVGEFSYVLRLDDEDVDALYHLGLANKFIGNRHEAIQAFKKCRSCDKASKWEAEISVHLGEI